MTDSVAERQTALPRLLFSPAQRIAIGVAAAAMAGLGFLPLLAGPGYEIALLSGLLLPSLAAVATAIEVSRASSAPIAALGRGASSGGALAVTGLVVVVAHGARVGFCDPVEGTVYFVLGPGLGAVLGGVWGSIVGLFIKRAKTPRRLALQAAFFAVSGPIAGIAISLYRFYASPMVFAYDPFFGFFAGTLYDTVVDEIEGLVTYRLGSAMTLLAAATVAVQLERVGNALVWRARGGLPLLALLAAGCSVGVTLAGPELGHWQTTRTIRDQLGRSVDGRRCHVVFSADLLQRDARLFATECDAQVVALERYFEARGPDRITIFLFATSEEKARLMGAANTYVAKPWRREAYLQAAGYPHPVLGHELAHVVAGEFGVGPFRIAGPLRGLIPDPGRIEGLAVAAAPSETDVLTAQQWAKAMRDLDLLPPLSRVFKLSFLGEPASRAYAVAGAFIEWFRQKEGAEALRRWYSGEPLREVAEGRTLEVLEAEWHASLDELEVGDGAMEVARARFDRPAIFGRRCPHVVDRLSSEGGSRLRALDHVGASSAYESVLELDPHHVGARIGLARCALRAGREEEARKRFQALADDANTAEAIRVRGDEEIGDLELWHGRLSAARERYRRVERVATSEDRLRTLDVKRSPSGELDRSAIAELLVGDPRLGRDWVAAASKLGQWAASSDGDGTPDYLLGKNLYNRGRWSEAAAALDRALGKRLDIERVRHEASRTRVIVACAMGDVDGATRHASRFLSEPRVAPARKLGLARFASRCGVTL